MSEENEEREDEREESVDETPSPTAPADVSALKGRTESLEIRLARAEALLRKMGHDLGD